jgi:hypothetical protein
MVTCPDSTNPLIAQPTTMTQDGKGTVINSKSTFVSDGSLSVTNAARTAFSKDVQQLIFLSPLQAVASPLRFYFASPSSEILGRSFLCR